MNAVIHGKYEAHVLTNDTIEVHLQYLRSGLDTHPVLRDKIDQLSTSVDAKIAKTNDRIDAANTSLCGKIEALNATSSEKILRVSVELAEFRGYAKTIPGSSASPQ